MSVALVHVRRDRESLEQASSHAALCSAVFISSKHFLAPSFILFASQRYGNPPHARIGAHCCVTLRAPQPRNVPKNAFSARLKNRWLVFFFGRRSLCAAINFHIRAFRIRTMIILLFLGGYGVMVRPLIRAMAWHMAYTAGICNNGKSSERRDSVANARIHAVDALRHAVNEFIIYLFFCVISFECSSGAIKWASISSNGASHADDCISQDVVCMPRTAMASIRSDSD